MSLLRLHDAPSCNNGAVAAHAVIESEGAAGLAGEPVATKMRIKGGLFI